MHRDAVPEESRTTQTPRRRGRGDPQWAHQARCNRTTVLRVGVAKSTCCQPLHHCPLARTGKFAKSIDLTTQALHAGARRTRRLVFQGATARRAKRKLAGCGGRGREAGTVITAKNEYRGMLYEAKQQTPEGVCNGTMPLDVEGLSRMQTVRKLQREPDIQRDDGGGDDLYWAVAAMIMQRRRRG
jgi:hypothetical protein